MTQFISTNKQYKRLFPEPIDPSMTWDSLEELNNYLLDPTCTENQIVGCNGKAYIIIKQDESFILKDLGNATDINEINAKLSEYGINIENMNTSITEHSSNIKNIQTILGEHASKLDELLYVPISINNISLSKTSAEIGEVVSNLILKWEYNKIPTQQKLNNEILDISLRTITKNSISDNSSFKIDVTDGKTSASKIVNINFYNGRYFGVSNLKEYDNNLILSLNKTLTNNKSCNFTVNCGEGQYIYFAIPSSFGTPVFTVGGFSGGFNKVKTIKFQNSYGHIEDYDIWKSDNSNLGNTTVNVG